MATKRNAGYASKGRSSGRLVPFLLGILFTLAVVAGGGWLYLRFGDVPVAVADKAFPLEARIVHVPLEARIDRGLEQPPFGTSEDVFEAGAKVYAANCAGCHGTPAHASAFATMVYPQVPQLWKKHRSGGVVGVSDDPAGETYWKVRNGIRLSAMPSYRQTLTETQMWDVSLLLKSADQPLPYPVLALLDGASSAGSRTGR